MTQKDCYSSKPWLNQYAEGVHDKIDYEETVIPDFLKKTALKFPNKTALNFQGYKVTYREFDQMVNRFATVFSGFGIQKGDSVAILLPNLIPCVVSYYAILRIGGIVVMNNPLYTDRELEHQLNDSKAKILVTLDLLADRMAALRPKTGIREIIYTSIGDYLPFPKNLLFPLVGKKKGLAAKVSSADHMHRWKDLLAQASSSLVETDISLADPAMYQYTGGTTGVAKGVILTHGNLSCQVQQIRAWFPGFKAGEEIMAGALPIFHVFGMTVVMNWSVINGWENVLIPKPETDALINTFKKTKPTIAPLVPTMFIGILNHPDIDQVDLTSIKGCFSGSAPLPVEVINTFEKKTGAVIVEGFGLSEASPVTHANPYGGQRKVGSIGIPVPGTESRIASLADKTKNVPVGEEGELLVRGPQVMAGYLGLDAETKVTLEGDWLHTGDIARMDEEGYFYIVDRIKDMIISSGYNVYPREIDEVAYENPKIAEACAVGIPHDKRGEQIKLFVVLKEGAHATEQEMIDFCAKKLARYKLPTEVEFRESLPKSNVGKILRKDLKQEELASLKK